MDRLRLCVILIMKERVVQENSQKLIVSALTGIAIRDIGLRVVDVESGVCVQDVRLVHGCVLASRYDYT